MDQPWNRESDSLELRSFPSTSILRVSRRKYATYSCTCGNPGSHRSLFDLMRTEVRENVSRNTPIVGVKVCWNTTNLWEDLIPRFASNHSRRVLFEDLPSVGMAVRVLTRHTFWFARTKSKDGRHTNLSRAIIRLIAGYRTYSGSEETKFLLGLPLSKSSVKKLQQISATIDGLLMQIVVNFMDNPEVLTWSYLDQVVNCLLSNLVPDYFRDERDERNTRLTTFEKVKSIRGSIKEVGFNPKSAFADMDIPQELSFFRTLLRYPEGKSSPLAIYKIATLAQTRGGGVPPKNVYYKTLDKVVKTLKEPSSISAYQKVEKMLFKSIDEIYYDLIGAIGGVEARDRFFTRCINAAKISLSDSGEFFTKSEDGGKLEAARKVLKNLHEVDKIDLNTGQKIGKLVRTDSNQGDMLFQWACNQFFDRKTVYDRNVMSVRISLVAELGKYRAITVSHLAHAVLLHVISHVLLEFLKGFPSSASGVGAANHAWNFFKRLSHKNPNANFIFGNKDVYVLSTDWETATDYCDHYIARAIFNRFCYLLGVPNWYRQTCVFALCAPRQVETLDRENRTLEMFLTQRGELMGDPCTKFILHAYHLVGRQSAKRIMHAVRVQRAKEAQAVSTASSS